MAITGNFSTFTPVPATPAQGGVSQQIYHVAVTTFATFTAGTWGVPHGLPYTPTWCVVIPRLATGGVPVATNALVAWSQADTDATHLAIALLTLTSATYDVLYG